jgi:DNA-binding LacI/PurR family transcriptional regulator
MGYASIKLIAARCGLSHATVSRALSNSPLVTPQTHSRILKCAQALRYRPNRLARNLRLRSTKTIGFVIPSVVAPMSALVAEHLYREAFRHGYNVFFLLSEDDLHEEMEAINEFLATRVDGLIVQSTLHNLDKAPPQHPLLDIHRDKFPCVLIRSMHQLGLPIVNTDSVQASYLATSHLLERGYREVRLLLATTRGSPLHAEKVEGFRRAVTERGIHFDPAWVMNRELGWSSMETLDTGAGRVRRQRYFDYQQVVHIGREFAQQALASGKGRPLGLVGSNDEIAGGVWGCLMEAGVKVPEEVGVVGCDDTLAPRVPLTSVRWDYDELARKAVECVMAQIHKKRFPLRQNVAGKLIVRKSSDRTMA